MSSGAYIIAAPIAIISATIESIQDSNQRIDALNKQRQNINQIYNKTIEEIEKVKLTIQAAQETDPNFEYSSNKTSISAVTNIASTETISGFSDDNLFFSEVDVDTGEIVLVVIDYSDLISIQNAKNSTEYKKMEYSSKLIKRLMAFQIADDNDQKAVNDFITLSNEYLDDKNISYESFVALLSERFSLLEKRLAFNGDERDTELWIKYCALCAIAGKRAHRLPHQQLELEINELLTQVISDKYSLAAREAFIESLNELDLVITGEYELDHVQGKLIETADGSDVKFFVSEFGNNFVMEMVEPNGNTADLDRQHSQMCYKRKQLAKLMEEKGYPIDIGFESDGKGIEAVAEKTKTKKLSNAERIRRRRAINGKSGKAREIGG